MIHQTWGIQRYERIWFLFFLNGWAKISNGWVSHQSKPMWFVRSISKTVLSSFRFRSLISFFISFRITRIYIWCLHTSLISPYYRVHIHTRALSRSYSIDREFLDEYNHSYANYVNIHVHDSLLKWSNFSICSIHVFFAI